MTRHGKLLAPDDPWLAYQADLQRRGLWTADLLEPQRPAPVIALPQKAASTEQRTLAEVVRAHLEHAAAGDRASLRAARLCMAANGGHDWTAEIGEAVRIEAQFEAAES